MPASFEHVPCARHGSKHVRFIISSMSHKNPVRQGYNPPIRNEESKTPKESNFSVVKWPFQGSNPSSFTLVYAPNYYTAMKKDGAKITTRGFGPLEYSTNPSPLPLNLYSTFSSPVCLAFFWFPPLFHNWLLFLYIIQKEFLKNYLKMMCIAKSCSFHGILAVVKI